MQTTHARDWKLRGAALAAVAGLALAAGPARGAGLLIADGGLGGRLECREHEVTVSIRDGIAVTKVMQVFQNLENRPVEALYTFPVPKGASVSNFSMWINGVEMVGEVLEKKRAREIYESYKRTQVDPGLLEQVDYKRFEMRIWPIAARAEQKVEVTYYQELEVDHDRVTYIYPLATVTEKEPDTRVTERFEFNLEVTSAIPITTVESPSHAREFVFATLREDALHASLEAPEGSLARDIVLTYELKRPKTGIDLITTRPPREDGYFMMTVTVGEDLAEHDVGMDYVFLLDISGSMRANRKLLVSTDAIAAFIRNLGPKDRFEMMSFNIQPTPAFRELRDATPDHIEEAVAWLNGQVARGGTEISPALTAAYQYADPDRPLNIVILSDGITDQRERTQLVHSARRRPALSRIFSIGVGNEVNRPLLEQISQESGGLAAFLSHEDSFERQAAGFRRKLMRPAVADLQIAVKGVDIYDLSPALLPDLFHGAPVRIYGRYRRGGTGEVTLSGLVQGRRFQQTVSLEFPAEGDDNPELERMWAWRRIDDILRLADADGNREAVIPEVVRLGEGYSIVTEYTSFLVLENDAEYRRWKIDRTNALRIERDRRAQEAVRQRFAALRSEAARAVGPQPEFISNEPETPSGPPQQVVRTLPQRTQPAPAATPSRGQSRDFNFGRGSGPVGPLMLLLTAWLARSRRRRAAIPT